MTDRTRVRARPAGVLNPITNQPVYRIEDADGRLLRRISGARDPIEAVALYWRRFAADATVPLAMPDTSPDARLRRRIAAALSSREPAATTPELPLAEPAAAREQADMVPGGTSQASPAKGRRPAAGRTRRAARTVAPDPAPQEDLFEAAAEAEMPDPIPPEPAPRDAEPGPETVVALPAGDAAPEDGAEAPEPTLAVEPELEPEREAEPVPRHEPEPEPEADAAIADAPPAAEAPATMATDPAPSGDAAAPAEPYHLPAEEVMLQRVDHRQLRPNDRPDGYLYHIATGSEARLALREGLAVSAMDPIILTERPGVAYWLSVLAEDFDVILDGPADFVVLRMRRHAVDGLLEHDPDASRSAGCACYLLTGHAES